MTSEERLSKRAQYASKPLVHTQSRYLSNNIILDLPLLITKIKPIEASNQTTVSRSKSLMSNRLTTSTPVKKPIYLSIDHGATLAERNRTVANQYYHRNREQNANVASKSSTNNYRMQSYQSYTRPNTMESLNSHIHNTSTGKSFDAVYNDLSGKQHYSTPQMISANEFVRNIEPLSFNHREERPSRSKSNHRTQTAMHNRSKFARSRENHRQHKLQYFQYISSPPRLNTESLLRRMDYKR